MSSIQDSMDSMDKIAEEYLGRYLQPNDPAKALVDYAQKLEAENKYLKTVVEIYERDIKAVADVLGIKPYLVHIGIEVTNMKRDLENSQLSLAKYNELNTEAKTAPKVNIKSGWSKKGGSHLEVVDVQYDPNRKAWMVEYRYANSLLDAAHSYMTVEEWNKEITIPYRG